MAFSSIPYFPLTIFPTFQLFSCLISVSNLTGKIFQCFLLDCLEKAEKQRKAMKSRNSFCQNPDAIVVLVLCQPSTPARYAYLSQLYLRQGIA